MTEKDFNQKAKMLLDENASGIDGATAAKLHQMRNRAVAAADRTRSTYPGWIGAGALAASLAVTFVYFDQQLPTLPNIYEDPVQQAAAEELDLMHDLDFMAWLVLEEGGLNDVVESS